MPMPSECIIGRASSAQSFLIREQPFLTTYPCDVNQGFLLRIVISRDRFRPATFPMVGLFQHYGDLPPITRTSYFSKESINLGE